MTNKPNNEIQLVRRPNGMPVPQDFAIVASSPRTPGKNDVLVRNLYMSVDPYMRGRMNLGDSYIPPFKLNHCMEGTAVGEVVESHSADFQPGDVVLSNYGWREYFTASSTELSRLSRDIQPLSIYLGCARKAWRRRK